MSVFRALALGLAVGFFAGLLPACGATRPCGPDTCIGCCDTTGGCVAGTGKGACGSAGAACVACPDEQVCASGFCSGSSGGGAGGGGGGSGGGGGGTTSPVDTFLTELTNSYCTRSIACGFTAANAAADCASFLGLLYFTGTSASVSSGASGFDQTAAGVCLSRVAAASCADVGREVNLCLDVFSPRAMTGGACFTGSECVQATDACGGPDSCQRTCRTLGTRDAPCRPGVPCDHGLYCQAPGNTCQPTVPPGSACLTSAMCDGDGFCTAGTCRALPVAGQPCRNGTPRCAEAAYCSGLVCQARQAAGGTCGLLASDECQVGLACVNGRCVARGGVDAPCNGTPECLDGLLCDAVQRRCAAIDADLPRGATCTRSTRYCRVDAQVCSGQTRGPDGGFTSSGTCRDSNPADPCAAHSDCNAGRTCAGGGPSSGRLCQDAGALSACASAANCRPSDDCVNGVCQARVATGARCSASGPGCLDPAAVCVGASDQDATLACRRLGAPGATCRSDTDNCQFPLTCADGGCVPAGHPGQPCLAFWGCLDGVCLERDGGPGSAPTGVCAPRRADGQPCTLGVNCVSGTCDSRAGVCRAACP